MVPLRSVRPSKKQAALLFVGAGLIELHPQVAHAAFLKKCLGFTGLCSIHRGSIAPLAAATLMEARSRYPSRHADLRLVIGWMAQARPQVHTTPHCETASTRMPESGPAAWQLRSTRNSYESHKSIHRVCVDGAVCRSAGTDTRLRAPDISCHLHLLACRFEQRRARGPGLSHADGVR